VDKNNYRYFSDYNSKDWIYLVKLKVRVRFTLEQATKAQRGSIGIALLFL
jgi:hypothetical protein